MARTKRNPKINSRTARQVLTVRPEPYWTVIEKGRAVGYRKGKKGGTWVARFRDKSGKHHYQALGAADDVMDPDGDEILSFAQAQARARDWFEQRAVMQSGGSIGPYTIERCINDYIAHMYSEGKPSAYDWEKRAKALIIPQLGAIEAKDLTSEEIRAWRDKLAASPARIRTRPGEKQQYKPAPSTDEERRQRKVSTNRTLTILKAALNLAFRGRKIPSDIAWRTVAPFKKVEAARKRFLTLAQAKRLINASSPEFRPVVRAALMTGARYGEMAKLRVRDFHRDGGTIFVEWGKNEQPRHIILTDEGVAFFQSLTKGRANPEERMFLKKNGTAWRMSHQARPLAKACRNARISPPVSFHQLRHTYASLSIMAGMTLMVLAENLGHSDTRMVEKHYGHLADDFKRKMIRETAPKFGTDEPDNVAEFS